MDMIWTMKVHVSVSNILFSSKLLKNVENIALQKENVITMELKVWKKMVHASVKLDSLETCVMNASEDTVEQPVEIAI